MRAGDPLVEDFVHMVTPEQVIEAFRARLLHDSPEQMQKADGVWGNLPLNFFYLTHAADTVDIVVTGIAEQLAAQDNVHLPDSVLVNLRELVGPKTLVKDAVRLIFLTLFPPESA